MLASYIMSEYEIARRAAMSDREMHGCARGQVVQASRPREYPVDWAADAHVAIVGVGKDRRDPGRRMSACRAAEGTKMLATAGLRDKRADMGMK